MLVGFFVSPFIVHRLGNVAYGLWIMTVSAVSYLTLLDLGLRSSVLRFVSKGYTQKDHSGASDALSAALWVRVQISALVLVFSGALAYLFPHLFNVPEGMHAAVRTAVLIVGVATALSMSLGVFGAVLSALNRYDLQSYITLALTLSRVASVVTVLMLGKGIVALAFCELIAAVVGNTLFVVCARKIYPELRITLSKPRRDTLRELWSYSVYAFLITMSLRIVYETDNLVVGAFVSAAAVTFYSIGNSLCRYSDQFVTAMNMTFVPATSTFEASRQNDRVRSLYKHGTRLSLALILPIVVTLMVRGKTFIGLWMGPSYAQVSGTVLMILAVPLLLATANNAAGAVAYGTGKHKTAAHFAIAEAVSNLLLSIVLVHRMGIFGVAIGTLIPSMVIHLLLWPNYIETLVGFRKRELFLDIWGKVLVAGLPFALTSYVVDRHFPVNNMLKFGIQVLVTLPVYGASVFLLNRDVAVQAISSVRSYWNSRTQQAAAAR